MIFRELPMKAPEAALVYLVIPPLRKTHVTGPCDHEWPDRIVKLLVHEDGQRHGSCY